LPPSSFTPHPTSTSWGDGHLADLLGEEVIERAKATAAVDEYPAIFETVDREKVDSTSRSSSTPVWG